MGRRGVQAAGEAAKAALAEIVDGTLFSIVSGNGTAQIVYPYSHQGALVPMSAHTRGEANRAIEGLRANGGTAMGTWLTLARQIFETVPHVTKRHAILLTDGVNEGETPGLAAGRGRRAASAPSSATAAASVTSGASTRCAASPRRCSAPSTSSRRRRRWRPSSRR